MKENAKFCTNCGCNLETYQSQNSERVENIETNVTKNQSLQQLSANQENLNKVAKKYWSYFMRTLLHPSASFKEKGDNYNGIIQFTIIAVLSSLSTVFFTLMWSFGEGFGTFFSSFLYSLFYIFVTVSIIFLLKKTLHKSNTSFRETASQFGGLFSGAIILLTLYLLMIMIAPIGLIIPILLIALFITAISIAAFNIYLFASTKKGKFDNYYITLIGNIIMLTFTLVVLRIAAAYVVNNLGTLLEEMFYYGFY